MRTIIISFLCFFFILTCYGQDRYELRISSQSLKKGTALLQYDNKEDALKFNVGKIHFEGNVQSPTEAFLLIRPGSDLPAQFILEKGKLSGVERNGTWYISGTPNNDALSKIKNQLYPYSSQIKQLREQGASQKGEAQQRITQNIDLLQAKRIAEVNSLIDSNINYAGLLTLKDFYLKLSASSLAHHLEQFKQFLPNPIYQQLQTYYAGMNKAELGKKVADFSLVNIKGDTISLASFKGKTVLIDFWFYNCVFCRQMVPALKNIYRDYHQKGFEIISVSVDARSLEKEWRKAVKDDQSDWTQLWDPEKSQVPLYGIDGYPNMFLVDGDGQLLQKIVGFHDENQFRQILDKYIK